MFNINFCTILCLDYVCIVQDERANIAHLGENIAQFWGKYSTLAHKIENIAHFSL